MWLPPQVRKGNRMPKNIVKKTTRPPNPKPSVTQSRMAYPSEQRDTDEPQRGLTKTAAGAAGALNTSAPAMRVEFSPRPTTVPAKPPAALLPSSVPPRGGVNPSQGSASQQAPLKASAPKVSPAAVSPTPKAAVQSAPPTSPGKSAVLAQAPQPTPKTSTINFALLRSNAKEVVLC